MYFQSLIDRLDQTLLVSQHLTMNIQKHKVFPCIQMVDKLLSEDRIMMVTLIFLNESNKYIYEYSCEIDVIYRSLSGKEVEADPSVYKDDPQPSQANVPLI